ncbi:MAG: type III restriction-modification system endonuclease [Tannerellaceae bacterium]|nr:type III restriction-modification system endonuclease [Tannerellaceae bacterium]
MLFFFIDNIQSYRGNTNEKGWLKEIFERLLIERLKYELTQTNTKEYENYLYASLNDISACHAGYFAQDNNDSDEAIAKEVDEILHNKKKLLSFLNKDGTLNTWRFLFSKWTLKEGWDNPNVFTITKLRSSGSENSKIQEVGRGLRLPVDEFGNRIANEEFLLNYIVDFTEADFANKLVAQINEQLPSMDGLQISSEDLIRVAKLRNIDENAFMIELLQKGYIDFDKNIIIENIDALFAEYKEFNNSGLGNSKIIDRNKKVSNKIKVRKARFDELKELWDIINRKYVIFFDHEIDSLIEKDLPRLFELGVFADTEVTSHKETVGIENGQIHTIGDAGISYLIKGRQLPYNIFLKRLNKATSISLSVIHNSICTFAKENVLFKESYINESSLTRIIKAFEDWKAQNMQGRFHYKQTNYRPTATALTNLDGTIKAEVVQGNIGIHLGKGDVSDKYLYDAIAYDSELEKSNIKTVIYEVIVYGKIPRRSISIPTIADSTYSPDFMYVVRKSNGQKQLNIVIETKDVENKMALRGNEEVKINCARVFFEQLKLDGYNVVFRDQLNNKGMAIIISDLLQTNS